MSNVNFDKVETVSDIAEQQAEQKLKEKSFKNFLIRSRIIGNKRKRNFILISIILICVLVSAYFLLFFGNTRHLSKQEAKARFIESLPKRK